jgi:uncharacterized membrane protein YgcG
MRRYSLILGFVMACSGSSDGDDDDRAGAQGDPDGRGAASVDAYCTSLCEKAHECDSARDLQTCRGRCLNELAAVGNKLRGEFLEASELCYRSQDCATVLAGAAQGQCVDEALSMLAPTGVGISFCEDYGDALANCSGRLDTAACYDLVKMFGDPTIIDASGCLEKSCSQINACVDASLGGLNGSGGSGGGSNSGAGGDSSAASSSGGSNGTAASRG